MKGWGRFLLSVVLLNSRVASRRIEKRHGDEAHGCDDGEHGIGIDLHGESDWKCLEDQNWVGQSLHQFDKKCYQKESAYHVCIDETIDNLYKADIPHSGPHRKVWAMYGEYNYLPPGRYVHNLEHGGVVFMYHPCAPTEAIRKLRSIAMTCLYRHIVTAFPKLTREYPFAVLTYGCVFRMSHVKPLEIRRWIRERFGKSPESDVYGNGQYKHGLLVASPERDSYDYNDGSSPFCPDLASDFTKVEYTPAESYSEDSDPIPTAQREDVDETTTQKELVDEATSRREPVNEITTQKELVDEITTQKELVDEATSRREPVNEIMTQKELVDDVTVQQELADDIVTTQKTVFPPKENKSIFIKVSAPTKPSISGAHQRTTHESSFNDKEVVHQPDLTRDSETPLLYLIVLCCTCFTIGLFLGFCVLHCRARGSGKMKKLRVWSDRNSADSFSVAAVVRKIPDSFTKSRNQNDSYRRLEANEQSSDEDNTD